MKKSEIRKKWIAALRSGKYQQGTGYLHATYNGDEIEGDYFCCLGVLCDILGVKRNERGGCVCYDGESDVLPNSVVQKVGLYDSCGGIQNSDMVSLADMNDGGKTFKEIAAYIERYPHKIFVDVPPPDSGAGSS